MHSHIDAVDEKISIDNHNSIREDVYEKYGVLKEDRQQIYNNYKLYNRIVQYNRKINSNNDNDKKKSKETYYCELCDKDVRVAVKYHHVRTMKHLKLKNEVERIMNEK